MNRLEQIIDKSHGQNRRDVAKAQELLKECQKYLIAQRVSNASFNYEGNDYYLSQGTGLTAKLEIMYSGDGIREDGGWDETTTLVDIEVCSWLLGKEAL